MARIQFQPQAIYVYPHSNARIDHPLTEVFNPEDRQNAIAYKKYLEEVKGFCREATGGQPGLTLREKKALVSQMAEVGVRETARVSGIHERKLYRIRKRLREEGHIT